MAIVTDDTEAGRHVLRHSTAHVMAQAVTQLFPGAKFSIGPAIENGFYYDFELPGGRTFSDDDLAAIEARMREIIEADQPFVRAEVSADDALVAVRRPAVQGRDHRAGRRRRRRRRRPRQRRGRRRRAPISVYRNTPEFVDLCKGPHVPSTGRLGHFKLQKVAGAYWRGNEKGPMLQRIYGTAWESEAALDRPTSTGSTRRRSATTASLATELDLLSFPSELGGGLAVWHPKGAIVRKLMEDYSRQRHQDGGYEFVFTPHLSNAQLFETSGHLDWYADGMYPPMEMDNGTYYLKPMNCPMHCLIFRSRQRSYRELPLRLFELGTVYRYERAGTLHGLMRIRGFTQDDSHIFCTPEQAPDEIASLLDFVLSVLRAFGFEDFTFNLSTKDPDEVRRHRRGLGEGDRAPCALRSSATASTTRSRRATPRSTARRSTSTCATRSAAAGSCRRSSTTSTTPSGSSSSTSAPTTPATGRSCCTAPCSARSSGSSACCSSTTPGTFRRGWRRCRCGCCRSPTAHEEYADEGRRSASAAPVAGSTSSRPATSSASASAPPSWRSCRTSSSSATTTSPPARSASTPRGSERPSAASSLETFVDRFTDEVHATQRRAASLSVPCSNGSGTAGASAYVTSGWRRRWRRRRRRGSPAGAACSRASCTPGCPTSTPTSSTAASTASPILNAFPYSVGHTLVLPYREVGDLEDLEPDEFAELWATVTDAVRAIKTAYRPDGVNVGVNLGRPAGGSVSEHLHVHVVPRWTGDSNFMTATANTRTLPEALPDSAAKLRAAWP